MPIPAGAGAVPFPISPRRPAWADMKQHYPDVSLLTPDLYDKKIGGPFVKLYDKPAYKNTCAVRMSYALNRCGIKLARAPSAGGSVKGGDGYWYWIRVNDLKKELSLRFKAADEELSLAPIPTTLVNDDQAMSQLFKARVKEAQAFIDSKLAGRNGVVAFDVAGWSDASGHFTLWDGSAKKLAYAAGHDQPETNSYYFWLTTRVGAGDQAHFIQVVKVKFWELK